MSSIRACANDKEAPVPNKKVLVAGASGLVGHAAVAHFASLPGWETVGVSRRVPSDIEDATFVSADLTDAAGCESLFGGMSDVTHLVYAALHEIPGLMPGWIDEDTIERNGAMLRNLFDPLSRVAKGLEHVSLLHGTKAYGLHHPSIGFEGMQIPLREREPRREHRNFYFVQEDYLREKQRGGSWGLTVFRPTVIYGDAGGNNMNPIPAIGAYAALLREEGQPLHFPGRPGVPAVREAVDADLVAHALGWAATSPAATGGTYNLTNGDVFMWENVWPAIAETLGMEPGESRPLSLAEELPKRGEQWAALVDKHDLRAPRDILEFVGYNSLVYADTMMAGAPRPMLPILNSTIAVRQAGFHECIDTEDMFRKWFSRLVEQRVLPGPR
jgi:nucleoside-diphosphate-sugar epimerase